MNFLVVDLHVEIEIDCFPFKTFAGGTVRLFRHELSITLGVK